MQKEISKYISAASNLFPFDYGKNNAPFVENSI